MIISITPVLTPFCNALQSVFVLSGGFVLKLLSNSCNSLSVSVKWCAATLQETSKPFFFASLIKSTDFAEEMVGMCNLPPVYSNKKRSLTICNSSAKAGIPFKPNFVLLIPSCAIPSPVIDLFFGKLKTKPSKF